MVHPLTKRWWASCFGGKMMSKSSPGMRADMEGLAASSRKRHFGCFVKVTTDIKLLLSWWVWLPVWRGPSEGSQYHLWPTGSWSKSSWMMEGLEELAVCPTFAGLLFIFVMLDGRCKGFSLLFHDCFATWDFLWYMTHIKVKINAEIQKRDSTNWDGNEL